MIVGISKVGLGLATFGHSEEDHVVVPNFRKPQRGSHIFVRCWE